MFQAVVPGCSVAEWLALASLLPLWLGRLPLKRWLSVWRRSWQGGSEDHHARNRSQLAREKKATTTNSAGVGLVWKVETHVIRTGSRMAGKDHRFSSDSPQD